MEQRDKHEQGIGEYPFLGRTARMTRVRTKGILQLMRNGQLLGEAQIRYLVA